VRLVIGTRPEAIKLAPVAHALKDRGIDPRLVFTGQHPALNPVDYGLGGFDAAGLRCRGLEDPWAHARLVATRLADHLFDRPALLVVQGDTSSALGGALAADALGIPLAHVEAGLRTHDREQPWPEEEFRVAIDARADLLLAPTELSAANLRAEKVRGAIHVTGNTSVDAVLAAVASLSTPQATAPRLLVTCHRRESWSSGLASIADAVADLAAAVPVDFVLHPNPLVARLMRSRLDGVDGVTLHLPCGHRELLVKMRSATLVLSDSGGIQEEAATLGAPLLVLREKTERPEAIATGNMILVGTGRERIVAEAQRLLADSAALEAMARPCFPYGDGAAGIRVADIIGQWLARKK
jgi:UDP-N-acetylglucosamine 2-epimerase (non-hydrolysing)